MNVINNYAGDSAWQEWFDLCSVARCDQEHAERLSLQIKRAMFAQLFRLGYSADTVGDDDPISFFDSFFLMKGSRNDHKPLKSYFRCRIEAGGLSLKKFICGTLFSSRAGRIHDIVRDWIASVRGWKPHSLVGKDGRRHLIWESAAEAEDARELCGGYVFNPGKRLDNEVLRRYAGVLLEELSKKLKVEKRKIAFLLYATAKGVPMSSPEVLAELGVKKSRAAIIKEKCMKVAEKFLKRKEVEISDYGFAGTLIAVCAAECGKEAHHG